MAASTPEPAGQHPPGWRHIGQMENDEGGDPGDSSADLKSPDLYLNRELSLLRFQERVLEEAQNPSLPLLERLKF
ncbi:MAG: hypothetical protein R3178_06615, partial [Rhodothermales bacterium]|nr:hypothetical protein [Rhodothermales bacterium]